MVIVEKILNASCKLGLRSPVVNDRDLGQFKGMAGEDGVAFPETPRVTGQRKRRTAPSANTSKSMLNEEPCCALGLTPNEALGTSIAAWPPPPGKLG